MNSRFVAAALAGMVAIALSGTLLYGILFRSLVGAAGGVLTRAQGACP